MENLLGEKEAATFLGISEERLKEFVDYKLIPAYMVGGQFLRFKKEELEVLKDLLTEVKDLKDERIFNKAFSKVKGIERFKEILRANDIYLFIIIIVILILVFMFLKK